MHKHSELLTVYWFMNLLSIILYKTCSYVCNKVDASILISPHANQSSKYVGNQLQQNLSF